MSSRHKKTKLNGVILDGYKGHEDVPDNVTHVRFHPSVVGVDYQAFEDCTKLRKVTLNDGLKKIGKSAFEGCNSLQSINIPSTVTKIKRYAFMSCTKLQKIVLNEGLSEIGEDAFRNCTALQSITIPSTVDEISIDAFANCSSLEEVVLNEGLKKIGDRVFERCSSLERITIPSTVNEIDKLAFNYCTGLREVILHNEKVQIGNKAFRECISLQRFKFPSLLARLDNIIQAGQRGIEAKMDDIPAVEWRAGELSIPAVRREIEDQWGIVETLVELDKEKLNKIVRLIRYYEIKEATTMFELAIWKARIDQANGDSAVDREACRTEVAGPVKETILQYLR